MVLQKAVQIHAKIATSYVVNVMDLAKINVYHVLVIIILMLQQTPALKIAHKDITKVYHHLVLYVEIIVPHAMFYAIHVL